MKQMEKTDIIQQVTGEMNAEILAKENILEQLSDYLNHLIVHDFASLVHLLYRLDIPEPQIKESLSIKEGEDAGRIIAILIIKRQLQKIESRKKYTPPAEMDENDRW